jgi:nicotinamidase-related amidase
MENIMKTQLPKDKCLELPVRYYRFFPGEAPLGETYKTMPLQPSETVILLVDVYHAAETPQGKGLVNSLWDQALWKIVDDCLVPLIAAGRGLNLPIIYVSNSSPRIAINDSPFGKRLNESLGFDPTIDFKEQEVNSLEFDAGDLVQLFIPPQISPKPGDYFIRKHTYSGFFETRLDSLLRNLGARNLICAGFSEDVCVLLTLADAVFRGYNTILVRDGTLATELPNEINTFMHTQRTTSWIESFLGPSTSSGEFVLAAAKYKGEKAV